MESPLDLAALPRAYRIGLRLQDLGADDDLIGDCLGIDPAGVATLLEIGRQKLEAGRPVGPQTQKANHDPSA